MNIKIQPKKLKDTKARPTSKIGKQKGKTEQNKSIDMGMGEKIGRKQGDSMTETARSTRRRTTIGKKDEGSAVMEIDS